MRMSLGINNNNPLNIRFSSLNKWIGLQGVNKGFCVFQSMDYGLRAGIITLRTYINKHHLTDVEDIIKRFAPSSENNTSSYISYVSNVVRCSRCNPCDIVFGSLGFCVMVSAMCKYEKLHIANITNREKTTTANKIQRNTINIIYNII